VAVIGGTCCYVTCAQGIGLVAVSTAGQSANNRQAATGYWLLQQQGREHDTREFCYQVSKLQLLV
jgi:hypothetical protein